MKPLKPEEFDGIGGAAPCVRDLPEADIDPLPLPQPVSPDIEINLPK